MEAVQSITSFYKWVAPELATKNADYLDLLLLIHESEIAISVYDDILRAVLAISIYKNENIEKINEFLEAVLSQEHILKAGYKSIKVQVCSHHHTLIPESIFDNKSLTTYLAWTTDVESKDVLEYNFIKNIDCYNVYALEKKLSKNIDEYFKKPVIFDFNSVVIQNLMRENKGTRNKKLFTYKLHQQLYLYFIDNSKLLFSNNFSIHSEEDFVYYVLAVCEHLQQNVSQVEVVLLGDILLNDSYHNTLSHYAENISWANYPKGIYFQAEMNELAAHQYFSLFSLALCE